MTGSADAWRRAPGSDPVGERLHEAAARLSPSADALERIQAAVMAEYERSLGPAVSVEASGAPAAGRDRVRRSRVVRAGGPVAAAPAVIGVAGTGFWERIRAAFRVPAMRRVMAVGLAAAMAVGSVSAVLAASGPGQPFYRLRLQVEALGLPAAGSPARLRAEIDRASQRLSELLVAGRSGDVAATADSSDAYQDALAAVIAGQGSGDAEDLSAVLGRHEQLLLQIVSTAPAAAQGAVARAMAAVIQAESRVQPPKSIDPGEEPASSTHAVVTKELGDRREDGDGREAHERPAGDDGKVDGAPGADSDDRDAKPTSGPKAPPKSTDPDESGADDRDDKAPHAKPDKDKAVGHEPKTADRRAPKEPDDPKDPKAPKDAGDEDAGKAGQGATHAVAEPKNAATPTAMVTADEDEGDADEDASPSVAPESPSRPASGGGEGSGKAVGKAKESGPDQANSAGDQAASADPADNDAGQADVDAADDSNGTGDPGSNGKSGNGKANDGTGTNNSVGGGDHGSANGGAGNNDNGAGDSRGNGDNDHDRGPKKDPPGEDHAVGLTSGLLGLALSGT